MMEQDGGVGLQLALDLQSIDLDSLLGPLEPKGGSRARRPPPQPLDPVAAQRKAIQNASAPGYTPQRAKAQHSLAHGPALGGGRCGERMQFTVTVVGEDGQVFRGGGVRVTAIVTGLDLLSKTFPEPRPWIEDMQDGTYVVQFVCATPGKYDVTACVDGVPLPMCPVNIDVLPGPPSALQTELSGPGTQHCEVGGQAEFTIHARDEFGNPCAEGGARFGVRAIGHATLLEVADNEDGTYSVLYAIPEYAKGTVQLEVLLNGVPVKGSPVFPRVPIVETVTPMAPILGEQPAGGSSLADQLEALRWLKEHPPVELPNLPPPGEGGIPGALEMPGAGTGGLASIGDASAARLAWRTADEWRRLNEMRAEMARAREALIEHQKILLKVGGAVHEEFVHLQDRARNVEAKHGELGEVEARLDGLRSDLWRQHMQQQRALLHGAGTVMPPDGAGSHSRGRSPEFGALGGRGADGGRSASPDFGGRQRSPGGPGFGGSGAGGPGGRRDEWSLLDEGLGPPQAPNAWSQNQFDRAQAQQLAALQEGLERKRRYLLELEEAAQRDDQRAPAGGWSDVGKSPQAHPLDALPPPDRQQQGGAGGVPRGRNRINEPLPPPAPPPRLENGAAGDFRGGAGGGPRPGPLSRPPPPPAPPPAVLTTQTGSRPPGWSEGAPGAAGSRSPSQPPAGGHTPEELGQAMRQLFHAFASRTAGSVSMPRGGRSGRVALGLQDYLRLAHAAQIRLPNGELEAVFRATARRFGGNAASDAEPTLAFELFVELLVETARMRYGDLRDAESTAALFEEHLLPLAHRLRDLGGGAVGEG